MKLRRVPETKGTEERRIAPTTISQMVLGLRYEPQYAVMDRIGSVIDAVLRTQGTPFGPETFPLSQARPSEYTLLNPENDASLRIGYQDTVLQLPMDTQKLDQIQESASDFQEFILTPLRDIVRLRNIIRYGVLLHLNSTSASFRNPPINRYLSSEFPRANSLSMRFSRRLPTDEALVRKRVDDFRNVIYTVEQSEEDEIRISIDYQQYFRPALDAEDWSERPFPKFVEQGLDYFQGEFQNWFKKLVGVPEVA